MDCIFCKIAKGEILCDKNYEDNHFLAFLDINPVNFGHTLLIPKKHYENILDAPKDILSRMLGVTSKLSDSVKKVTNCDGFEICINNGKASGQIVPHLHLHIIPRFFNDKLRYDWPTKKYKEGEAEIIASKIRKEI